MPTPFYKDRFEILKGRIFIYHRSDTQRGDVSQQIWWACFRLPGHPKRVHRSLKTTDKFQAEESAQQKYLDLRQRLKDGESLTEMTFALAWERWYLHMDNKHSWSAHRLKWHKGYFKRYFEPYFGRLKLSEVSESFAEDYWPWRINRSSSEEGQKVLAYNHRRAGSKTSSTNNVANPPSHKTLDMERSALNQIFRWFFERKWINRLIKLRTPSRRKRGEGRRSALDPNEWSVLTRNLRSYADVVGRFAKDKPNSWHKQLRQQLRFYVLFLGSTGLRPGEETRFLRWADVTKVYHAESGQFVMLIRVPEGTKTGAREVYSMPAVVGWLEEWRKISLFSKDQDYIFHGPSLKPGKQTPHGDLNKAFQKLLSRIPYKGRKHGLLLDANGTKRVLYCIRHYYATDRLRNDLKYEDLSRNMGTSIKYLVEHYDHIVPSEKVSGLIKTNYKKKQTKLQSLASKYGIDEIIAMIEKQASNQTK